LERASQDGGSEDRYFCLSFAVERRRKEAQREKAKGKLQKVKTGSLDAGAGPV